MMVRRLDTHKGIRMNWAKNLRRWTMRSIHSAILGAALLGTASLATAQTPSITAAKLPKQHFTRSQSFDLPIVMEQDYRVSLSEIRLYVKTPTTGWKLQESVAPHATRFNCKVTQDGEYWYTLATVDRAGRMTPADVNLEPPSQRVVIDTILPVIQARKAISACAAPSSMPIPITRRSKRIAKPNSAISRSRNWPINPASSASRAPSRCAFPLLSRHVISPAISPAKKSTFAT